MADATKKNSPQSSTDIAELIRGEFIQLKISFEELLEHIVDMIKPLSER